MFHNDLVFEVLTSWVYLIFVQHKIMSFYTLLLSNIYLKQIIRLGF